jgi:hypothetical protein
MGDKAAAQKEFAKVRELHQKEDDLAAKMLTSQTPPQP